jgi:hypothetical protein
MATIAGNLSFKTIGETIAGELFITRIRGSSATCIHLESYEGDPILGMLKWEDSDRPSYSRWSDKNLKCVSYGTDWLLDPILGPESFPRNSYEETEYRVLYLHAGFAVLRLGRAMSPTNFEDVETDILGNGRQSAGVDAVPVRHWRIWASEADRNRPGAKPIVEFGGD